jgi:hypothetical protein
MKKADFRKVEIENINGEKEIVDLSKILGNGLYSNAKTLEVVELARSIWKDGEVELKEEDVKILEEQVPQLFPAYIVKTAILNTIK